MRLKGLSVLLCVALAAVSFSVRAENIGQVDRARGATSAAQDDTLRPLTGGSAILFEDVLRTGAGSRLHVTFDDGTRLMMGDSSELAIDAMVYNPDRYAMGVMRLTQGVFRMVTGQVNKMPGGTMTVITPMASIGVRGTDFWGQQSADQLLMALLDDGELTIVTEQGSVTLTEPNTAVLIHEGLAIGPVFKLTAAQVKDAVATIAW
jgi:hypothetical protein